MAKNVVPFPKPAASPCKSCLVRGIDAIPEHYELLSAMSAMSQLGASETTLRRLADEATTRGDRKVAAALRRCATAAARALDSISGGFDVRRMEQLTARHRDVLRGHYPGIA